MYSSERSFEERIITHQSMVVNPPDHGWRLSLQELLRYIEVLLRGQPFETSSDNVCSLDGITVRQEIGTSSNANIVWQFLFWRQARLLRVSTACISVHYRVADKRPSHAWRSTGRIISTEVIQCWVISTICISSRRVSSFSTRWQPRTWLWFWIRASRFICIVRIQRWRPLS